MIIQHANLLSQVTPLNLSCTVVHCLVLAFFKAALAALYLTHHLLTYNTDSSDGNGLWSQNQNQPSLSLPSYDSFVDSWNVLEMA